MIAATSSVSTSPSPDEPSNGAPQAAEAERLAAALSARTMGARMSAALGAGDRPCHVLDAKYEPGVRAVVLYEYGKDLVRGDLLSAEAAAGSQGTVVSPGVRLSVFPHDPDLAALPQAMDPTVIGPLLADVLRAPRTGHGRALRRRCRVGLLRYRPGRRATVRVATGLPGASYVAKVYHDQDKASAVAREALALAGTPAAGGVLRLAPTVAHLPTLSLVVQLRVRGEGLGGLVSSTRGGSAEAAAGVRRAAVALGEMHDGPVVSARRRPVTKELNRFVARARQIGTVDRLVGCTLLSLAERLLDTYAEIPAGPLGLVHGDCKPDQFLLDGDGPVYLLDLDHCGVADQAGDVGTFAASLRQLAVQRTAAGAAPTRTAHLHALAETFVSTYTGRRELGVHTIRWYEVVALQRKAIRAFARSPRSPLPTALALEGHRCLDRLESAR